MKMFFPVFLALLATGYSSSLSESLTQQEQNRLASQLQLPQTNLESIFYAVTALKAIGKESNHIDAFCKLAKEQVKQSDANSVFQFTEIIKVLKCKDAPKLQLSALIKEGSDSITIAKVVAAMVNSGEKVTGEIIKKFVNAAKDNDTPASAASSFYAASLLPNSAELKPIVSMVEDIVAQADEIGGELLQFEGGLAITSEVVRGILNLADQQGSALLKEDQVLKFAKYFISRKYVYALKDSHSLIMALNALSNNKKQVPVVVSVFKSNLLTSENPELKVRVTNVLDQSIPEAAATVKSFSTADESVTLFENRPFSNTPADDDYIIIEGDVARGYIAAHSLFLNVLSENPSRGMYKCSIIVNVKKDAKRFVHGGSFTVTAKVLARIMVEDVVVAYGDKDQTNLPKSFKLTYPDKLSENIDVDYHQKIVMTFNLKDLNSGNLVTAHQTFIRLVSEETNQEIFFVAEPDSDDHYKFTLDVASTGKESFNNLSGKYKMSLIVGDATMQVPITWPLGDVSLTFSGQPKSSKRQERNSEPKPVIEHMFRVPEKRPAKVVSTAFTALVLSPLLVMLAMWAKSGANLSNFSFSLPTLIFHVGLAAIFVLYYLFWIQYNMFDTMKLLIVIGGVTFLGGNKMLADMAAAKYKA